MGVNEKTGNDRGIDKKYEKKILVAELKKVALTSDAC